MTGYKYSNDSGIILEANTSNQVTRHPLLSKTSNCGKVILALFQSIKRFATWNRCSTISLNIFSYFMLV